MVETRLQLRGTMGSAFSGNSVRMRSIWPILRKNALCPSMPTINAMRAVPTLDE